MISYGPTSPTLSPQLPDSAQFLTAETAVSVTYDAVQIHGGTGYFKPSIVERIFRDAKVTEIYEGTSEIQRNIIAERVLKLPKGR